MEATYCPSCGNPLRPAAAYCSKCGAVIAAARTAQAPRPVRSRRVLAGVVVLVVVVAAVLGYLFFVFLPSLNVVKTGDGIWIVSGGVYPAQASCSDCGRTMIPPGSIFTIHLYVSVSAASCFFGCGDSVTAISVNAPYLIVSLVPDNLPNYISENSGYTWALNVQAPATSGHYALGGLVALQ